MYPRFVKGQRSRVDWNLVFDVDILGRAIQLLDGLVVLDRFGNGLGSLDGFGFMNEMHDIGLIVLIVLVEDDVLTIRAVTDQFEVLLDVFSNRGLRVSTTVSPGITGEFLNGQILVGRIVMIDNLDRLFIWHVGYRLGRVFVRCPDRYPSYRQFISRIAINFWRVNVLNVLGSNLAPIFPSRGTVYSVTITGPRKRYALFNRWSSFAITLVVVVDRALDRFLTIGWIRLTVNGFMMML